MGERIPVPKDNVDFEDFIDENTRYNYSCQDDKGPNDVILEIRGYNKKKRRKSLEPKGMKTLVMAI